jgi:8-hydroxy-5-deazaflavin:NADPH oxidoreductase
VEDAMKIGVIGAGRIGALVGRLWVKAGHEVRFSSRHPETLQTLVKNLGPKASAGTVEDAAAFGEVLLISVPYSALPALGRSLASAIKGKVVLETGNVYPARDGAMAQEVIDSGLGSGVWTAKFLAGARVVRAFNTVWDQTLSKAIASGRGQEIGIPIAGDDRDALDTAARLVSDAGFEPVVVGGLDQAKRFDVGAAVYNTGMSAAAIKRTLGI